MKKFSKLLVAALVIAIGPIMAYAGQPKIVEYLRSKPLSAFDYGLFRLEHLLIDKNFYLSEDNNIDASLVGVSFNNETNKIEVYLSAQARPGNKIPLKEICRIVTRDAKMHIPRNVTSGLFISWHRPETDGMTENEIEELREMYNELNTMVDIVVLGSRLTTEKTGPDKFEEIKSTCPLHNNEITFQQG